MPEGDSQGRSGRRRRPRTRMSALRRPLLVALVLAMAVAAVSAIGALASGGAPTAETEHATSIARTSVVLNAAVNPNGSAVSECYFEYGTSEASLTSTAPCSYSPGEGETPVPVLASVSGLSETTTYFFRIHAKSGAGQSSGVVSQFTTLPTAPISNTEAPTAVGHTSVTLSALVTPDGAEVTECFFEYGTDPSELNQQAACASGPGSGGEPVPVHASIGGLPESTLYYYRVVAGNSFGTTRGGRSHFETLPSAPHSNTEPAVSITHTSAILRGFVTPNGAQVQECFFEWGISSVEEHRAACEPSEVGSGEAPVAVSAQLSGLAESVTYHFRLVASNSHGTGTGGGTGFTTLPYVPKTLIQRPAEMSDESALLRAKIDPQDESVTECRFEYGTTPALGKVASCNTLPGVSEKYSPVTAAIKGLTPTTTYLVRLRAVDGSGITYSKLESFTTFQAGLLPSVSKLKPRKGSSAGGNSVTITGQNLLGAEAVTFGETETKDITSDSADSLTVVAPPGFGTVDVVVTTASGQSQIVSGDRYAYGKPIIALMSPNHGKTTGGTLVTVTGSGFEPGTSGTTFHFSKGEATSVECTSSSTCTMLSPPAYKGKAGTVKVTAKANGLGSSSSPGDTFTYES